MDNKKQPRRPLRLAQAGSDKRVLERILIRRPRQITFDSAL